MAKEEKLLTVRSKLNDRDFEDVFKIYMETERGKDKRIGLMTCAVLGAVCLVLMLVLRNMTFGFFAAGCLIVAVSYWMVPVNRKFLANNKLQFGEWREMSFFPHSITVLEIFEENEAESMDEEELAEATTKLSTVGIKAYENERGFLFAQGRITDQFLYVPKRGLKKQELADLQEFAKERCSGGYRMLEMNSMLGEDEPETDPEETSLTAAACDRYYGAKKLHLYDADGNRVDMTEEQEEALEELDAEEDAELEQAHTEIVDVPELDVDGEWERIIAEEAAESEAAEAEETEDE